MSRRRYLTCVVGFGKIAHGYSADPKTKRYFPYCTHAEVLAKHPDFEWVAVVDRNASCCEVAKRKWKINAIANDPKSLGNIAEKIEVLVLATPPESRLKILKNFPKLRAVVTEKPLGLNLASSSKFLKECRSRKIMVQVNLWRRGDPIMRQLAYGKMKRLIGMVQGITGLYGNGIKNNAIHLVDLIRMLFGEIKWVKRIERSNKIEESPILGDRNFPFILKLNQGPIAYLMPIRFRYYRENGLQIWGTKGSLQIFNEGLVLRKYSVTNHRAMRGEREISMDKPVALETAPGKSLFHMYTNLANALQKREKLWSSGNSALKAEKIIHKLLKR